MTYYVARVKPRSEKPFAQLCRKLFKEEELRAIFPSRALTERKQGRLRNVESPLFPGYVFLETEQALDPAVYHKLKTVPGFFHVLKPTGHLSELKGEDLRLVLHFLRFGQVMQASQVVFDENQRIRVLSGPMTGMEGQIVAVDRRKGRAKIRLDFDHSSFTINLAFEVLESVPAKAAVS